MQNEQSRTIQLPKPVTRGRLSLEEALAQRRSIRRYADQPLTLAQLGQLLWAAQGITAARGYRTAPSAGALYPLEIYAAVGQVAELAPGVYRYEPDGHELTLWLGEDRRDSLAEAALGQSPVRHGAAVLVFAAVFQRTTAKYGSRGFQYVYLDAGHAAQNVCLQAEALGLGLVPVGAFRDEMVSAALGLPREEQPVYLLPVGSR